MGLIYTSDCYGIRETSWTLFLSISKRPHFIVRSTVVEQIQQPAFLGIVVCSTVVEQIQQPAFSGIVVCSTVVEQIQQPVFPWLMARTVTRQLSTMRSTIVLSLVYQQLMDP